MGSKAKAWARKRVDAAGATKLKVHQCRPPVSLSRCLSTSPLGVDTPGMAREPAEARTYLRCAPETAVPRYTSRMEFEWDPEKAVGNHAKHGIDFIEASTIFGDPLELTLTDPDHSGDEFRFLSLGSSSGGRLLVVSYTERGTRIRIISAREATPRERRQYESTNA